MIMNFPLRNFNRNVNTVYFQLLIDGYLEKVTSDPLEYNASETDENG